MLRPYLNPEIIEAGCDEAGRGCLAGPVYAAAVVLPKDFSNELLNDSKQLTEAQRYTLREVIEREAVTWAIGIVTAAEIDDINILRASILAMQRAVSQLKVTPEHLLIDGNRVPLQEHTIYYSGKGRCNIYEHSSRLNTGKDLPRRLHAKDSKRTPCIRLAQKQRLPTAQAPCRHTRIWCHTTPPYDLQPHRRRPTIITRFWRMTNRPTNEKPQNK